MGKPDPNITARNEKALTVPCSFCGSQIGESCWALRAVRGEPKEMIYQPHKGRIKAAWQKRLKDRKVK